MEEDENVNENYGYDEGAEVEVTPQDDQQDDGSQVDETHGEKESSDDNVGERKYPHFSVAINKEELAQGFQAPFTVSIAVDPEMKKGDLLKAIVDGMNKITASFDKDSEVDKYTNMYRKWACRTFNLSDRAFNSLDGLTEETSKVENNFVDALNASPTVEQLEPVPIIGFGDDSSSDEGGDKSDGK